MPAFVPYIWGITVNNASKVPAFVKGGEWQTELFLHDILETRRWDREWLRGLSDLVRVARRVFSQEVTLELSFET